MSLSSLQLLIDFHLPGPRLGPGSDICTRRSIDLSGLGSATGLRVADIGCGTGAATLVLAHGLDAEIIAVDLVPQFLERLTVRAEEANLARKIRVATQSMDALEFDENSLDAIWSEGAIYHMGFANGLRQWRKYLKPGGIIAISELTWLTDQRPAELASHWLEQYPEVDTASGKFAVLEQQGYTPLGYFVLPANCWMDEYYHPLQKRFHSFLQRHDFSVAAQAIVSAEQREIALYERYQSFFGYGYYVARKISTG